MLRAAGVEGEILPWRENLLEGPVRRGPSGAEQDDRLQRALAAQEPVMLWFEADLFDVLLLIQILERVPSGAPVLLVLVGQERWEPSEERWVGRDPHSAGCAGVAVGCWDGARGAVTSDA